jgi:hypothetical protein
VNKVGAASRSGLQAYHRYRQASAQCKRGTMTVCRSPGEPLAKTTCRGRLAYGKQNSENLAKSADYRAKAGPVFSGNAEVGYSLCLKAKSETRLSRC